MPKENTQPNWRHRAATNIAPITESWGTLTWLANEKLTGDAGLTLGRVVIKTNANNPRHRHPTCDEVLYLLKGRLQHSVGKDTVLLEPGDVLSIPANEFHHAQSIGSEDAEMIVAYTSGRRDFELERTT